VQQLPPMANRMKSFDGLNDDDDDGLGFDPFAETQKALAEMLESETRQRQQQHTVHQRQQEQQREASLLMQQHQLSNGGDRTPFGDFMQSQQQQQPPRPKAPPPGFTMASGPGAQPALPRFSGNGVGGGRLDGPFSSQGQVGHHPQVYSGQHQPDLLTRMEKVSPTPGPMMGRVGFGGRGGQHQPHHGWPTSGSGNANISQDWQDGLRALLPNVNVSFGNLPSSSGGGGVNGGFRSDSRGGGLDSRGYNREETRKCSQPIWA